MSLTVPADYRPLLDLRQTEVAIKKVKDFFERDLAIELNLTRVSAPLFVPVGSGSMTRSTVSNAGGFDIGEDGREAEIVQSLAKWKRYALGIYSFARVRDFTPT